MSGDVEEAPWFGAGLGYVGWVPNVRSHLSFSMIAAARGADAFTRAYSDRPERLVIVHQQRVSRDLPWSDQWIRRQRPDLVHDWVLEARTRATSLPFARSGRTTDKGDLVAEHDRQGMLIGAVHVLPYQTDRAKRDAQAASLLELRTELDRPSALPSQPETGGDDALDGLRERVVSLLACCFNRVEIQFALMRTGELRLWFDEEPVPSLSSDEMRQIAEQAYFFVKDAVHDHAHHDPSSDQITPLHVMRGGVAEPGHGDEVAWRRETLWSLSREVERLHRKGGLVSLKQSLGVIAYAEAFQTNLMGHVRCESDPMRFLPAESIHDFDFAHLKDSVRASIDVAATRQSQVVQLILAGGGTFVSTAALATSIVNAHNGLARAWDEKAGEYAGMAVPAGVLRLLMTNPLLTGAIATLTLLLPVVYTMADGEGGLFNGPQRVFSQFARAASVSTGWTDARQYACDVALHVAMLIAAVIVVGLLMLAIWVGA